MPRVSGLKTNRTNSPNISSLILIAGDLAIFHKKLAALAQRTVYCF